MSTASLETALTLRAHVEQFTAAVQSASADFRRAMGDIEGSAGEAGTATTEAGRGAAELGQAAAAAAGDVGQLGQAAGGTADQARTLGEAFGEVKANLAAAGVALGGVTLWLGNAASKSTDFGRAMAEVSTLLDDTSAIPQLTEDVRRLSREFGGDVQRNTKALYDIVSAGAADATAAVDTLTASNKLAIGGVTDVGVAADGLTSTMNAYGEAAGTATEVSDAFFTAVKAGKTTVGELAGSIGQVAPIAAQAGVGLEELLASVATLTTGGVQTGVAMTQVRAAISSVIKPSAEAQKLAAELGLQFDAQALKAKGLAGFLDDVARATGGNTEKMAQLFGSVEALGAVLALTGTGAEKFGEVLAGMEERAGATDAAVAKMMDTPAARAARFRAAMNDIQLSVGDAVTAFSPLLELATGALRLFNDLPAPLRTTAAAVGALAIAVPALTLATRQLLIAWTALKPLLVAGTFTAMVGPLGAATAAILAKVRALGALRVALASTGVGALVVGAGMLASKFIEAKHAAEEGERAVDAMLAERPVNGPAAAVATVSTETERANGLLRAMQQELRSVDAQGKTTADALQAAFDNVDISSVDGIATLIADLDNIKAGALATGDELQAAIGNRLKSLSAGELAEFATMAEMAFNRAGGSAETLAQINEAVLAASFAKLGLTTEKELGRVTPAAREAIGALDGIRTTLATTATDAETRMTALGNAVSAALSRADTVAAVEQLRDKVREMGESGELAGDRLTRALEEVERKLKGLKDEVDPVEAAFKRLGVTTQEALKRAADEARKDFELIRTSGRAATEDLVRAFTSYAERAIAANGGVASEALKTEAAMAGLKLTADETGRVIVEAMHAGRGAAEGLKQVVRETAQEMSAMQREAQQTKDTFDRWRQETDQSRQTSGPIASTDFSDLLSQAESAGGAALRERLEAQLRSWIEASNMASVQGTYSPGIGSADDMRKAMQAAIIAAEQDAARRSDRDGARTRGGSGSQSLGTNPMATASPFAGATPSRVVQVNLNVGGQNHAFFGSPGDVDSFLRSLEIARGSAS